MLKDINNRVTLNASFAFSILRSGMKKSYFSNFMKTTGFPFIIIRKMIDNMDVSVFEPVFASGKGAGSYSPRVLITLKAIKEGQNLGVEDLLSKACTDSAIKYAAGIDESGYGYEKTPPSKSTYYTFFGKVLEYDRMQRLEVSLRNEEHKKKGEKLEEYRTVMTRAFEDIVGRLVKEYGLTCENVRMDSVLVGSNIAAYGRYRLMVATMRLTKRMLNVMEVSLPGDLSKRLEDLLSGNEKQAEYRDTQKTIEAKMLAAGNLAREIVKAAGDWCCTLLVRLLKDQFTEEKDGSLKLIPSKDIKGTSLQSPFDPDANFRTKGNQRVKGYVVNMIETVLEESGLNLILSVDVQGACTSDQDMLTPALDAAERVSGKRPKSSIQDGGYQSEENSERKGTDMVFTGFQGKASMLQFSKDDEGNVKAFNTFTSKEVDVTKTKKGIRVTFENEKGETTRRYYTSEKVDRNIQRQEMANLDPEIRNRRNNVEAGMFELVFTTRNRKTRYRGQDRNAMFFIFRALWINVRRITAYLVRKETGKGNLTGVAA